VKQFFRYIFVGTLSFIPLLIVIQLLVWVNTLTIDLFDFVSSYTNSTGYTIGIFAITLIILALVGSSIEKAGKSYLVSLVDLILAKVPAINTVYSIIKKITALFSPGTKDEKKEVVLVEYHPVHFDIPTYHLPAFLIKSRNYPTLDGIQLFRRAF